MTNLNSEVSAITEAAILHSCGVDLKTTFENIKNLRSQQPTVVRLFDSLLNEWSTPSPHERFMFVGPFREREKENSDYAIFTAFSEVGSLTTMMSEFWLQGVYAYLLKRKVLQDSWTPPDVLFARQILSVFDIGSPLRTLFSDLNKDPQWKNGISEPTEDSVQINQWLDHFPVQTPSQPFQLESMIRIEMERAGLDTGFLMSKKQVWIEISSRLEALK